MQGQQLSGTEMTAWSGKPRHSPRSRLLDRSQKNYETKSKHRGRLSTATGKDPISSVLVIPVGRLLIALSERIREFRPEGAVT